MTTVASLAAAAPPDGFERGRLGYLWLPQFNQSARPAVGGALALAGSAGRYSDAFGSWVNVIGTPDLQMFGGVHAARCRQDAAASEVVQWPRLHIMIARRAGANIAEGASFGWRARQIVTWVFGVDAADPIDGQAGFFFPMSDAGALRNFLGAPVSAAAGYGLSVAGGEYRFQAREAFGGALTVDVLLAAVAGALWHRLTFDLWSATPDGLHGRVAVHLDGVLRFAQRFGDGTGLPDATTTPLYPWVTPEAGVSNQSTTGSLYLGALEALWLDSLSAPLP